MSVKTTLKKIKKREPEEEKAQEAPVKSYLTGAEEVKQTALPTKKRCPFCEGGKLPSYTDVAYLRKFISDRAKILNRQRSGVCSKHQRKVAKEIKYARHLSMLPFTNQL